MACPGSETITADAHRAPRAPQQEAQMGIDDLDAKVDQVVDKAKDFLEEEKH